MCRALFFRTARTFDTQGSVVYRRRPLPALGGRAHAACLLPSSPVALTLAPLLSGAELSTQASAYSWRSPPR
eukprot:9435468-Pyramimonas_sp.AAC.1